MANGASPLVTVYITCYNYEEYVRQAIESVLCQTFRSFELLIIDDGSTDGSKNVIREYEGNPYVRIIFQQNKGLNRTNNVALRSARGKYIVRLDADDYLDANALLVMSKAIDSDPNLGMVFPDFYYVNREGEVIGQERRHDFKNGVTLMDQPAHGACTMIRVDALKEIDGYCESYKCQDGYDVWLKLTERYDVLNIRLPLFYYRRHGNNLTKKTGLILETRARILQEHADRAQKPDLPTLAILAVRGKALDSGCIALEPLGGMPLIDWTILAALESTHVAGLVVTSPDRDILEHVNNEYAGQVVALERPADLAWEKVDLAKTVRHVLDNVRLDFSPKALMPLSVELPFKRGTHLDKAINSMRIFPVDSVIAVFPENASFYQHNGHGLKVVGNDVENGTLWRESGYIFRHVTGMQLVSMDFFEEHQSCFGGRIGHVTLDRDTSMAVYTPDDIDMANYVLSRHPRLGRCRVENLETLPVADSPGGRREAGVAVGGVKQ